MTGRTGYPATGVILPFEMATTAAGLRPAPDDLSDLDLDGAEERLRVVDAGRVRQRSEPQRVNEKRERLAELPPESWR